MFVSFDFNFKLIFHHYFFILSGTVFVPQYLKTAQAVLVILEAPPINFRGTPKYRFRNHQIPKQEGLCFLIFNFYSFVLLCRIVVWRGGRFR